MTLMHRLSRWIAIFHLQLLAAVMIIPAPAGAQDCIDARPSGVTLCSDADQWTIANPGYVAHAFDEPEFFPGIVSGGGCLTGPPGPTLPVSTGEITVRGYNGIGVEACALMDGSSGGGQVSDGWIETNGRFEIEFDPPTIAFFTYFGSLAIGQTVTLELFDETDTSVDVFFSDTSTNNGAARGYGFWSTVPIQRIEFTSSENGPTVVGAFVDFASGVTSLGTVTIPGYQGPDEGDGVDTIELDFAVVLDDCNGNGVADSVDVLVPGADLDADGTPDDCEDCLFMDDTLDCDENGLVDGCEVPEIIDPSDPSYPTFQDAIDAACFGDQVVIGAGQTFLASAPSSGDVNVEPSTLVIGEGATLEFLPGGLLRVGQNGALLVNGTESDPALFTTQGGGSPDNRWNGIVFDDGSEGSLAHARIEFTNNIGIRIEDASPIIDAVTIEDVEGVTNADAAGILVAGANASPSITNSTLMTIAGGPGSPGQNGFNGADGALPGDDGQSTFFLGFSGEVGGIASGINVAAGTASISNVHIAYVTGGVGGQGGRGGIGGDGQDGLLVQDGGDGGDSGSGGVGGDGGDAWGIRDAGSPGASIHDVTIRSIQAGPGGRGGGGADGGIPGSGGSVSGQTGRHGDGGNGNKGGDGGTARGIQSITVAPASIHQNLIDVVEGGTGGTGGDGGSGGSGQFRGSGGHGGIRGSGGWGIAIAAMAPNGASSVVQNTIVGVKRGLMGDPFGFGGVGAPYGTDDFFSFPSFPPPVAGSVRGYLNEGGATAGVVNNVFVGPSDFVVFGDAAVDSTGGPVTANYNCWWQFDAQHSGNVSTAFAIEADPLFVDSSGTDNLAGTIDDDLRLTLALSPCIDAGDNAAAMTLGLTLDLDGEPRFVDDLMVGDTGSGTAPIVDRGAYEVPEPSSLLSLGSGCLGLFGLFRLRQRSREESA
jgi:hypothetical protein